MQASDIPSKFSIPFANSAGGSYARDVPVDPQTGGAASLTTGFPPENFLAIAAGGIPPWGEDVNGILRMITRWTRWLNAGGMVEYDAVFSAAVGGYPQGAFLLAASGDHFWLSTVDNNTSNPDAGGSNWFAVNVTPAAAAPLFEGVAAVGTSTKYAREDHVHPNDWCATSSGTANAQIVTAPNGVAALFTGLALSFKVGAGLTNTGATTLQVAALAATAIVRDGPAGPVALTGGELVAGNIVHVVFGTTSFHLVATALGSAARADATSGTGKVVAMSGTALAGNLPVFSDAAGTQVDSGVSPGSLAGSAEGVLYQLGQTF